MVLQLPRPTIANLIALVYEPLAEACVLAEEYYAERWILAHYVVDEAILNDLMLGGKCPNHCRISLR
jgi:hypothetical protein